MKKLRVHSDTSTDGKLFCSFISLIAASRIPERLKEFNDSGGHRRISKDGLINELDKIRVVIMRGENGRLMNPLTKLQRELPNAFGISEHALQTSVANVEDLCIRKSSEI
jgi:hypothetical protein